jgi:hypothetical protein
MTKATLKALTASIKKYEALVTAEDVALLNHDFGDTGCPLCRMYIAETGTCAKCPVAQAGYSSCKRTPWERGGRSVLGSKTLLNVIRHATHHSDNKVYLKKVVKHLRMRCAAEAEFLKSLLPE